MCLGFTFFDWNIQNARKQKTSLWQSVGSSVKALCVSDFDHSKPLSAHILVSSSVWCEVLRHISQCTQCALLRVVWSWASNLQFLHVMLSQGCAPTSSGWSICRTSGAAGWELVLQHWWCSSSSPLRQVHTWQCRQCLCSPCTQDRELCQHLPQCRWFQVGKFFCEGGSF